jgi:DNA ligase (NAD+)
MDTIPKFLNPEAFAPFEGTEIEIRGEVYMSLASFDTLKDRFSNPRNATAGTLKRKEDRNAQAVGLKFYAYDVLGLKDKNTSERLALARSWGFDPVPFEILERSELQAGYEKYIAQRTELDYEIDGIVYRAERTDEFNRLGSNSHHPRGAIAYKLQGESAQTTLKEIQWNVSRNGLLTPVGLVKPVSLSGAMVSRITLHNWGMVQSKKLSIGAEVIAMRRGGVIPHLETVVIDGEYPVDAPSRCPECPHLNAPTEIVGDHLFCRYNQTCDAQAAAILKHYVSTTKIEGFGQVWLDTLTQNGILNTPLDLYTLHESKVIGLDGVGRKRAQQWIASINQSRVLPLATFLAALGVNDLGKTMAKALAHHFKTLDAIRQATEETISDLPGFGDLTAKSIINGLKSRSNLIDDLLKEITLKVEEAPVLLSEDQALLKGKSFLFTGTLVAMKRSEAQAKVVALGGKNASSVSAKLSYLVIGDAGKAGSKLTKAQKLGISILKETEFIALTQPLDITPVDSANVDSADVDSADVDSAEVDSANVDSADVDSANVDSVSVHKKSAIRIKDASFLFTGTLEGMKRSEAQAHVVRLGGRKATQVDQNLSYLVIGNAGNPGSKLVKAKKLGIDLINENDFIALIHAQSPPQTPPQPSPSNSSPTSSSEQLSLFDHD